MFNKCFFAIGAMGIICVYLCVILNSRFLFAVVSLWRSVMLEVRIYLLNAIDVISHMYFCVI